MSVLSGGGRAHRGVLMGNLLGIFIGEMPWGERGMRGLEWNKDVIRSGKGDVG